jgi:hypothetical protein
MKKILAGAVLALALASFAPGQTQCLLTYISESIAEGTVGVPYQFQLEACCGTPPYRYAITGGALPQGLHMNQNGKITGKPTAVEDTTVFILLTDNAGCSLTQAFAVRTNPAP